MSFLVTRPARPLPGIALISRLCSAAILRTNGVERRRKRSSADSAPPFPSAWRLVLPASVAGRGAAAAGTAAGEAVAAGRDAAGAGAGGAGGDGWTGAADLVAAGAAGGVAGFSGAVAAAPTSLSILATTVCTATVSPSCTRISASTPAAGDGI